MVGKSTFCKSNKAAAVLQENMYFNDQSGNTHWRNTC